MDASVHDVAIRLGREDDLDALMAMYAAVVEHMEGTAEDVGWVMGSHPSRAGLAGAIGAGTLIVATCERHDAPGAQTGVAGALIVDDAQPSGYEHVRWSVEADAQRVSVIHLFATAPWARGRGVARALLAAAAEHARQRGCVTLRLDVFPNAAHAIAVYGACGYTDLGLHTIVYPTCENTVFRVMDTVL